MSKKTQWEVKELPDGRWGVFLKQEFCKTDEPVCYGAAITKEGAENRADRLNNPIYKEKI